MSFVKTGSPKQAKYAIRCIDATCRSKDVIFKQLFEVRLYIIIATITMSCALCSFDEDVLLSLFHYL